MWYFISVIIIFIIFILVWLFMPEMTMRKITKCVDSDEVLALGSFFCIIWPLAMLVIITMFSVSYIGNKLIELRDYIQLNFKNKK